MQQTSEVYKYVPIKVLGKGSYGKAYLVEYTETGGLAVIKTIQLDLLTDEEKKEAYLETKILEKLDHPNIIKFREVFLTNTPNVTLHLVMDYAEGGDLESLIRNQTKYFPETLILDWFTQICLAIKHIHDRKILHRDIKSQNIFLTKNYLVKLGDFGIAKCLNNTLERVQTITGTPYYLSPEMVLDKPYSFKSDIWSLGVLLYEMCALKMPFTAQSLPKLSLNIIKGVYKPLPLDFSKEIRQLCSNLLHLDQALRPSIYEILKYPIIKNRIKTCLSEFEYSTEFSHTILHKYNLLTGNTTTTDMKIPSKNNPLQLVIHNKPLVFDIKAKDNNRRKEQKAPKQRLISGNGNNTNLNMNSQLSNIKKTEQQITNYPTERNPYQHLSSPKMNMEKDPLETQDNWFKVKDREKIDTKRRESDNLAIKNALSRHKKQVNSNENLFLISAKTADDTFFPADPENQLKKFMCSMHKKISEDDEESETEINDLVSTHKMLEELNQIEQQEEDDTKRDVNVQEVQVIQSSNESPTEFNLAFECKPDLFQSGNINSEDIHNNLSIPQKEEIESDYSELEEIRKQLEEEMGLDLLLSVYKIIVINTPETSFKYNEEELVKKITNQLTKQNFSKCQIGISINKIPEIWILVLKERQENLRNKV